MDQDTPHATLDDVTTDFNGDDSESSESRSRDAIYQKARVARDKLNTIMNELGTKADHAEKRMRTGVAHTETRIKDNPFAAVAVAAGLGLVVGLLLNRRQ